MLIGLLSAASSFAQHLPLFTQYRENLSIINPGAINHDYMLYEHSLSFGVSYRTQWTDVENSPETQVLRGDYIFADNGAVGLIAGGYILNDQTGPTGMTGVYGRVGGILTDDPYYGGLSLGLSFGLVQYRVNGSEIRLRELNDVLLGNDDSQLFPDVGFGVYYYKLISGGILDDSRVYGGISVPQVFGLDLEFENDAGQYKLGRVQHFYGLLGLYKYFRDDSFIEPSVWIKYVPNAPVNVDFNLRYQFPGSFWLGTGLSTAGNAHLEAGFLLGENLGFDNNFRIGYGLDYSFQSFGPTVGSTHEINLSYTIGQ